MKRFLLSLALAVSSLLAPCAAQAHHHGWGCGNYYRSYYGGYGYNFYSPRYYGRSYYGCSPCYSYSYCNNNYGSYYGNYYGYAPYSNYNYGYSNYANPYGGNLLNVLANNQLGGANLSGSLMQPSYLSLPVNVGYGGSGYLQIPTGNASGRASYLQIPVNNGYGPPSYLQIELGRNAPGDDTPTPVQPQNTNLRLPRINPTAQRFINDVTQSRAEATPAAVAPSAVEPSPKQKFYFVSYQLPPGERSVDVREKETSFSLVEASAPPSEPAAKADTPWVAR
jgi:hypothetical protein